MHFSLNDVSRHNVVLLNKRVISLVMQTQAGYMSLLPSCHEIILCR